MSGEATKLADTGEQMRQHNTGCDGCARKAVQRATKTEGGTELQVLLCAECIGQQFAALQANGWRLTRIVSPADVPARTGRHVRPAPGQTGAPAAESH